MLPLKGSQRSMFAVGGKSLRFSEVTEDMHGQMTDDEYTVSRAPATAQASLMHPSYTGIRTHPGRHGGRWMRYVDRIFDSIARHTTVVNQALQLYATSLASPRVISEGPIQPTLR